MPHSIFCCGHSEHDAEEIDEAAFEEAAEAGEAKEEGEGDNRTELEREVQSFLVSTDVPKKVRWSYSSCVSNLTQWTSPTPNSSSSPWSDSECSRATGGVCRQELGASASWRR